MNAIQNTPALRFPSFTDKWNKEEFEKIAVRAKEKYDPTNSIKEYPCIELEHISQETGVILGSLSSLEQKSIKNKFKKGDVLFGKLRPYLRKYAVPPFEGVCSSEIWVLKGKKIINEFLFSLIQTEKFIEKSNITSGSKMPRADWSYIGQVVFHYPSDKNEQKKISVFLRAVDEKIARLSKKKDLLVAYKKGVMQKIFKQEIRFKDNNGNPFPDWKEKPLGKIADRVTEKNSDDAINYVLTNSATQGVVSQQDYFEKDIANQDNLQGYYVVKKDDFVYNPRVSSTAPVGPVKRNHLSIGVMSPLYSVFRFTEGNLDFYERYFETSLWHRYLHSVANIGARHDRMNITTSDFQKMPMPFPHPDEQKKIAEFLGALDKKIDLVADELEGAQAFKKGLLQQMFV